MKTKHKAKRYTKRHAKRYTNRDGKPFSAVLVKLARLSPPEYAEVIEERNLALEHQLLEFKNWLAKTLVESDVSALNIRWFLRTLSDVVELGCPHCNRMMDCTFCLYRKAGAKRLVLGGLGGRKIHHPCIGVRFPSGARLHNNLVWYGPDSAGIEWYRTQRAYDEGTLDAEIEAALGFVRDHIDWARLDCWGQDYNKKDTK